MKLVTQAHLSVVWSLMWFDLGIGVMLVCLVFWARADKSSGWWCLQVFRGHVFSPGLDVLQQAAPVVPLGAACSCVFGAAVLMPAGIFLGGAGSVGVQDSVQFVISEPGESGRLGHAGLGEHFSFVPAAAG